MTGPCALRRDWKPWLVLECMGCWGGCWGAATVSPISTTVITPDLCVCNSHRPLPESLWHLSWLQTRLRRKQPRSAALPATGPLARREGVGEGSSQQERVGGWEGRREEVVGAGENGRGVCNKAWRGEHWRVDTGPKRLGRRQRATGAAQGLLRSSCSKPKPMGVLCWVPLA